MVTLSDFSAAQGESPAEEKLLPAAHDPAEGCPGQGEQDTGLSLTFLPQILQHFSRPDALLLSIHLPTGSSRLWQDEAMASEAEQLLLGIPGCLWELILRDPVLLGLLSRSPPLGGKMGQLKFHEQTCAEHSHSSTHHQDWIFYWIFILINVLVVIQKPASSSNLNWCSFLVHFCASMSKSWHFNVFLNYLMVVILQPPDSLKTKWKEKAATWYSSTSAMMIHFWKHAPLSSFPVNPNSHTPFPTVLQIFTSVHSAEYWLPVLCVGLSADTGIGLPWKMPLSAAVGSDVLRMLSAAVWTICKTGLNELAWGIKNSSKFQCYWKINLNLWTLFNTLKN